MVSGTIFKLVSGVFIYISPFVLFDGMYVLNRILYFAGIWRMLAKWICWQIVKIFSGMLDGLSRRLLCYT
jgi:hypothetical protein